MASLIAQAHRLAMQDQLYKGLHAGQLYWFVYPWWVKKHVLHSITECIKGITDCSALLTHSIAGVLFATWLHVYLQHERPCIRIDQQGDCCTVFPRFAFFFLLLFRIQLDRLHIGSPLHCQHNQFQLRGWHNWSQFLCLLRWLHSW